MNNTLNTIQVICSVISLLSLIFIAIQLFQTSRAEKKHHEEIRRTKTVEIMENWSKSLKKETSFAEKIVEGFSPEQCRALFFKESFELDKAKGLDICQLCNERACVPPQSECTQCISGDKFMLEGVQLSEFRWYVIGYLNMLESVMTAWNLNIVDSEEIEKQFKYLYNPERGWNALKSFRVAAGGTEAYPNIEKFMKKLEANRNAGNREHPKL